MLPKKLKERIEEESKKLDISEEEFIVEALSEYLKIDPEYRIEVHLALSEKYLKEAEEFLEKGITLKHLKGMRCGIANCEGFSCKKGEGVEES